MNIEPADDKRKNTPHVSDDMVAYLDRLYPDRCPRPIDTEREIWMAVGRRDVVRHLASVQRTQAMSANEGEVRTASVYGTE